MLSSKRPRPSDRGTVLLMVIGVLALLAIIAVVYATIGRSDRATSAALVRSQRVEDRSAEIVDYVKGVVSGGLFAPKPERDGRPGGSETIFRRRIHDYPWNDPLMLSIDARNLAEADSVAAQFGMPGFDVGGTSRVHDAAGLVTLDAFNPEGAVVRAWPDADVPDLRDFGTPFLASTEPAFLGHLTGSTDQRARNVALDLTSPLSNLRDWAKISTIGPSGNPVNLANLRNNFGAESGWSDTGAPTRADGTPIRRMSDGLTLFQAGNTAPGSGGFTGRAYDIGRPTDAMGTYTGGLAFRQPVPVRPGQPSRFAHPMRPADWTTNQLWAFRPAIETEFDPGQYAYLFNQWADADGDGFIDSRWFELVDVSAAFLTNGQPRQVLATDGRVRYFVAARIIDASSMINVNTAADLTRLPGQVPFTNEFNRDQVYPPGVTPADVDLRRVLMRLDFDYDNHRWLSGAGRGLGYLGLARPETAGDLGDYGVNGGYTLLNSLRLGSAAAMAVQSHLARGSVSTLSTGLGVTPLGNAYGQLGENITTPQGLRAAPPTASGTINYTGSRISPTLANLRRDTYIQFAARGSRFFDSGASPATLFTGGFGMDDELELRRFNGLNDSGATSPLEIVAGGRHPDGPFMSPLRDNRPLSLEFQGREFGGQYPYRHLFGAPADAQPVSAGAGVTATRDQTLIGVFGDIRRLLTTRSGARPLYEAPGVLTQVPGTLPVSSAELATDLTQPLAILRQGGPRDAATNPDRVSALGSVYEAYLNALLPFRNVNLAGLSVRSDDGEAPYPQLWPSLASAAAPASVEWVQAAGLAFGGRAEIAARTAMALAVNAADMADVDYTAQPSVGVGLAPEDTHERTAVTFVLGSPLDADGNYDASLDFIAALPQTGNNAPVSQFRFPFPAVYLPLNAAPPADPVGQLANATHVAGARAINMFGVEPQPFVIEAMSLFLYSDAPIAAGGDDEPQDPPAVPGDPAMDGPVTIRLEPRLTNPDFLGEIVAFQVTNPFDDTVLLYRPSIPVGASGDRRAAVQHYFKLGERYFLIAEQDPAGYTIRAGEIRLDPGETKVFYAINPGTRDQFNTRLREVANALPGSSALSGDVLQGFIDRQFGTGAIQIPMVSPVSLTPVGAATPAQNGTINGNISEWADLWSENTLTASPGLPAVYAGSIPAGEEARRKVVSLYRVVRTAQSPLLGTAGDLRSTQNDPENDLLVDRLRDPDSGGASDPGTLLANRSPGSGNQEINGTQATPESAGGSGLNDNTGFSIILWGAVRRPTGEAPTGSTNGFIISTGPNAGKPRLGILPPWALEAKSDNDPAYLPAAGVTGPGAGAGTAPRRLARWSLNAIVEASVTDIGTDGDYPTTGERFENLRDLLSSTGPSANPEMPKSAYAKRGNPMPRTFDGASTPATGPFARREYVEVAPEFHTIGFDDRAITGRRTSRNAGLFSRVGDLLLPLAIAPWHEPLVDAANANSGVRSDIDPNGWVGGVLTSVLTPEYQWTSLAEALALATGYYAPAPDAAQPARTLYANFGVLRSTLPQNTTINAGVRLDRGHLRLDAFTPYRLLGASPTPTSPREPIGAGIPFALNVLSVARLSPGVGSTLDAAGTTPTNLPSLTAPGSTFEAVSGLVNVNTAPLGVVGAVPLMRPAPDTEVMLPGSQGQGIARPWTSVSDTFADIGLLTPTPAIFTTPALNSTTPTAANFANDFDVATGLLAYREKTTLLPRPFVPGGSTARQVSFDTLPTGSTTAVPAPFPTPVRAERAGVSGLREGLGFRSVGEILAVNHFVRPDQYNPLASITRMGWSRNPTSPIAAFDHPLIQASRFYPRDVTGRIDASVRVPRSSATPAVASDVPGLYGNKIALATAASGSVSVRSDIFVVYLLIHGYTPEDVLVNDDPATGPVEPMTPSIAKRYVMVLDRSNVTSPNQEPRVLMLQEVPVSP
jgi:hypothetical protein